MRPEPQRASIPLRPAGPANEHRHERTAYDAPYRLFIAASLTLAIAGGLALAIAIPIAHARTEDLGGRITALQQAHGQLQLLGFAGLFTMGMALRMTPRFSGRALPWPALIRALIPLMVGGLVLRWIAQVIGNGAFPATLAIIAAAMVLAAAAAFSATVWRMLLHRDSRAEATGWFLSFGAGALVVAAVINGWIVIDAAPDAAVAPFQRQQALLALEQYGFIMLFIGGIATRAIPALTGHARPDRRSAMSATVLAAGVALLTSGLLWVEREGRSEAGARLADAGMIIVAAGFAAIVVLTGVFRPRANRVAAASQTQFWFVRAGMAWLLVAAAMLLWYALPAFARGELPDAFEFDALRHAVGLGVITNMIVGMAMLVVPEFAGRRLQHPDERWIIIALVVALNIAVVLRVWPATEGTGWLESTRWWPMAAAGVLAEAVLVAFAFMFAQSWLEQRKPGWGSAEALAARGANHHDNDTA